MENKEGLSKFTRSKVIRQKNANIYHIFKGMRNGWKKQLNVPVEKNY